MNGYAFDYGVTVIAPTILYVLRFCARSKTWTSRSYVPAIPGTARLHVLSAGFGYCGMKAGQEQPPFGWPDGWFTAADMYSIPLTDDAITRNPSMARYPPPNAGSLKDTTERGRMTSSIVS